MNFDKISSYFHVIATGTPRRVIVISLILVVGWIAAKSVSRWAARFATEKLDVHRGMIVKRASFYLVLALAVVSALNEAGINLSVIVGAAGVASVAIGFASQTSMSNLISGIFILIEKPFMIGDTVRHGATVGEVSSMGLMSTMLKTADNTMVRIPNESLMKSEITNITRYSKRRFEVLFSIEASMEIEELKSILFSKLTQLKTIHQSPAAQFVVKNLSETQIQCALLVWAEGDKMLSSQTEMFSLVQASVQQLKAKM